MSPHQHLKIELIYAVAVNPNINVIMAETPSLAKFIVQKIQLVIV